MPQPRTNRRTEVAEAVIPCKREDAVLLLVIVAPFVAPLVRHGWGGRPVELVDADCEGPTALVFVARAHAVAQAGAVPAHVPVVSAPAL